MALPGLPDPGVRDLDRPACPAAMASPVVRDPPSRPRRDSWNSPAPVGEHRMAGSGHLRRHRSDDPDRIPAVEPTLVHAAHHRIRQEQVAVVVLPAEGGGAEGEKNTSPRTTYTRAPAPAPSA